jgi:hypothetical protein
MTLRIHKFMRAALAVTAVSTCACTLTDASLEGTRDPTRLPRGKHYSLAALRYRTTRGASPPCSRRDSPGRWRDRSAARCCSREPTK